MQDYIIASCPKLLVGVLLLSCVGLAGCQPGKPATIDVREMKPFGAKANVDITRMLVMEALPANFSDNQKRFETRFRQLSDECAVTTGFWVDPAFSAKLTLESSADSLANAVTTFQPDGAFSIHALRWNAPGMQLGPPDQNLDAATYVLDVKLFDGTAKAIRWHGQINLQVRPGSGGEVLAESLVNLLKSNGVYDHCPK